MPQTDVREVDNQNATVSKKRRFDKRDFDSIAEFVIEEAARRKRKRKDLSQKWDEIDRQIRMEPDLKHKKIPGKEDIDPNRAWMAETELPLQAQTLEVLTADARRMMFAGSQSWFRAHAETPDEYLDRVDFTSLIAGDETDVPSRITQDNADKLVEGWLNAFHRQYDFPGYVDRINAEAFKYGVGVGRLRMATKDVFIQSAKGTFKRKQRIPVLFPRTIRNTYLDDSPYGYLNEGLMVGPSIIEERFQKLEDLILAASRGSNDPDNERGGWMPSGLKNVVPDNKGMVQVLEYEGDLIVPRKTVRSIFIPGAIVTIVVGGAQNGQTTRGLIRFRFRKHAQSSYVLFPYHVENLDTAYASSPLMKGRPIQIAAVDALNRIIDSGALKNGPPTSYERDDPFFAQSGGPIIHPYALWGTTGEIKAHVEIGGDPAALMQIYIGLLQQYADVTGVNAPRLGAQTISHTTAFAKDVELTRGTIRTVDYVNSTGQGPMTQVLSLEYEMAREDMGTRQDTVWLDSYGGFVNVTKDSLPDKAAFEWFGANGPADEQQKMQARLAAAQMALQIDALAVQFGKPPTINHQALIEQVLREGGWQDIDAVTSAEGPIADNAAAPGIPGAAESGGGTPIAALQALAG